MCLAAALNGHGLVPTASEKDKWWVVTMRALDGVHKDDIDAKADDNPALTVGVLDVGYGTDITSTASGNLRPLIVSALATIRRSSLSVACRFRQAM